LHLEILATVRKGEDPLNFDPYVKEGVNSEMALSLYVEYYKAYQSTFRDQVAKKA
jgi:hypothetical protein